MFDEDTFQDEIEKMHDRLYMYFFDDRIDSDKLSKEILLLYNDIIAHEMNFLSEFNFDNLEQDDEDFKSFLFKRESRISKKLKLDYYKKLQACVYPNDIVSPYSYKRAFTIALQRFLKDFERKEER